LLIDAGGLDHSTIEPQVVFTTLTLKPSDAEGEEFTLNSLDY
jgi:hypothetical protein